MRSGAAGAPAASSAAGQVAAASDTGRAANPLEAPRAYCSAMHRPAWATGRPRGDTCRRWQTVATELASNRCEDLSHLARDRCSPGRLDGGGLTAAGAERSRRAYFESLQSGIQLRYFAGLLQLFPQPHQRLLHGDDVARTLRAIQLPHRRTVLTKDGRHLTPHLREFAVETIHTFADRNTSQFVVCHDITGHAALGQVRVQYSARTRQIRSRTVTNVNATIRPELVLS